MVKSLFAHRLSLFSLSYVVSHGFGIGCSGLLQGQCFPLHFNSSWLEMCNVSLLRDLSSLLEMTNKKNGKHPMNDFILKLVSGSRIRLNRSTGGQLASLLCEWDSTLYNINGNVGDKIRRDECRKLYCSEAE